MNSCIITEYPRIKEYNDKEINERDRVYRVKIIGDYQLEIDDCAKLVYFLLKNKVKENFFREYKEKIIDAINDAETYRDKLNNNGGTLDEYM